MFAFLWYKNVIEMCSAIEMRNLVIPKKSVVLNSANELNRLVYELSIAVILYATGFPISWSASWL